MTTNHSARKGQQTGMLKTALVVGSLVATLAGTRLLAAQDTAVPETAVPTDAAVTVVVPAESSSSTLPLPPTSRGTQVELQAIPQVVQPQIRPVVRARSSR
ncbi:MAG: hypothetical protein H6652_19210 [Ardenticatenaceae bacterium]|nr:hypothetical protein [Ardenticatenaceae bacterium]